MKEELTYLQKAESACYADVPLEKQTIAMLLEYFDAMSRLYQLIPIQRVFEIINQQNPESPVPEEGFIKLTELFLDYNDGKYQYCILSPKEIFDENAVSEPFERYLLHEAALILDDSYEELVRMQFGKSYYIPEKEELLHYADEDYYEDTPERAAVYDFLLHKMRLSQKDAEDVMHEFLAQLEMNSEISRIFWDLGRIGYELNQEQIEETKKMFSDVSLYNSMFENINHHQMHCIFNEINDYKMYRRENSRLLPLKSLKSWRMTDKEIVCKTPYDFKAIYCRIEIEDREVQYWEQPMIEALGMAVIGIFTCVDENGSRQFLVRVKHEMGCFDCAEVGPVIQLEPSNERNFLNDIEKLFLEKLEKNNGVMKNVLLSEEGGRFYHEQNRNVIIEINNDELPVVPKGYYWLNYATINQMIQFNNCVNIQLRNLMALLEM